MTPIVTFLTFFLLVGGLTIWLIHRQLLGGKKEPHSSAPEKKFSYISGKKWFSLSLTIGGIAILLLFLFWDKLVNLDIATMFTSLQQHSNIATMFANVPWWMWIVVLAISLLVVAKQLDKPQFNLSSGLRTVAWVIMGITIIFSGFGMWTISVAQDTNSWFDCRSKPECIALKKQKEEEKKRAKNAQLARTQVARTSVEARPKPEVITAQCGTEFASRNGCVQVTFRNGGSYPLVDIPIGMCPIPHSFSLANIEYLHDDAYLAKPKIKSDVTVSFFNISVGERYRNFTCGG